MCRVWQSWELEKIWSNRKVMTKLFDINQQAVADIRAGLNDLSDWLLTIQRTVGTSSSKLSVDAKGRLIVSGEESTIITGSLGVGVNTVPNDVAIETSLPVRFQGRKFEVNNDVPRTLQQGRYDMNDNKINGTLGWIVLEQNWRMAHIWDDCG